MTFTGANAIITEIALLEFGLEIDANSDFTQINPDFVDREGVVHPDPGGGLVYDSPIGADERDKWEVDYVVKIVPGTNAFGNALELYWRAEKQEPLFLHGAVAVSVAGFPCGVCAQEYTCSGDRI